MREMFHSERRFIRAHENTHGGEAVFMRALRETFQTQVFLRRPHEEPHGREAVPLQRVWEEIC